MRTRSIVRRARPSTAMLPCTARTGRMGTGTGLRTPHERRARTSHERNRFERCADAKDGRRESPHIRCGSRNPPRRSLRSRPASRDVQPPRDTRSAATRQRTAAQTTDGRRWRDRRRRGGSDKTSKQFPPPSSSSRLPCGSFGTARPGGFAPDRASFPSGYEACRQQPFVGQHVVVRKAPTAPAVRTSPKTGIPYAAERDRSRASLYSKCRTPREEPAARKLPPFGRHFPRHCAPPTRERHPYRLRVHRNAPATERSSDDDPSAGRTRFTGSAPLKYGIRSRTPDRFRRHGAA